jgi:hypothetical protein
MHPKRAGSVGCLRGTRRSRKGFGIGIGESRQSDSLACSSVAAALAQRCLRSSADACNSNARLPAPKRHRRCARARAPRAREPCDGATARRGGWTRIACTVVLEASSRARNDLRQCSSASTAIALKYAEKCCGSLSGESRRTTKRSGGKLTAARVCVCVHACACVCVACYACVHVHICAGVLVCGRVIVVAIEIEWGWGADTFRALSHSLRRRGLRGRRGPAARGRAPPNRKQQATETTRAIVLDYGPASGSVPVRSRKVLLPPRGSLRCFALKSSCGASDCVGPSTNPTLRRASWRVVLPAPPVRRAHPPTRSSPRRLLLQCTAVNPS